MIENWLFGITSALAEEAGAAAAAAETAEEAAEMSPIASLLTMVMPLLAMGLIFYFMLIRPQRKKDKKVKEMLAKVADRLALVEEKLK